MEHQNGKNHLPGVVSLDDRRKTAQGAYEAAETEDLWNEAAYAISVIHNMNAAATTANPVVKAAAQAILQEIRRAVDTCEIPPNPPATAL